MCFQYVPTAFEKMKLKKGFFFLKYMPKPCLSHGLLAQLVARKPNKLKVSGSIPLRTIFFASFFKKSQRANFNGRAAKLSEGHMQSIQVVHVTWPPLLHDLVS